MASDQWDASHVQWQTLPKFKTVLHWQKYCGHVDASRDGKTPNVWVCQQKTKVHLYICTAESIFQVYKKRLQCDNLWNSQDLHHQVSRTFLVSRHKTKTVIIRAVDFPRAAGFNATPHKCVNWHRIPRRRRNKHEPWNTAQNCLS